MKAAELWAEMIERERRWFEILCHHASRGDHVFGSRELPPQSCLMASVMLAERALCCRN
jgi:hypothetical protein